MKRPLANRWSALRCCINAVLLTLAATSFGQSVGINVTGAAPHASALLDVDASGLPPNSKQALLIPRMTSVERMAIPAPAEGLLVYDHSTQGFWFYDGTVWQPWLIPTPHWQANGNTGTIAGTHFIGTTGATPFRFRVGSFTSGKLDPLSGNIGGNTSFGHLTLQQDGGSRNVVIGFQSLPNLFGAPANDHLAIGREVMQISVRAAPQLGIGVFALRNLGPADPVGSIGNMAIGAFAMSNNPPYLGGMVAVGSFACDGGNGTMSGRVSLGSSAGRSSSDMRVALGFEAAHTGGPLGIGARAAYSGGGSLSTGGSWAVGASALENSVLPSGTGENIAVGYATLYTVTEGDDNIGLGYAALTNVTSGDQNVGVGAAVLLAHTTGDRNTAIGFLASGNTTTGSDNTAIGGVAGSSLPNAQFTTAIGYGATPGVTGRIVFGTPTNTNLTGGYGAWQNVSDARFKGNVRDDVAGLSFITELRPVSYQLDAVRMEEHLGITAKLDTILTAEEASVRNARLEEVSVIRRTGLIAQEVEATAKLVGCEYDGVHVPETDVDHYTIAYANLVVPLVKALQEQQVRLEQLKAKNRDLMDRLTRLEQQL